LFFNCLVKDKNKQKGLILVDGFTVRFANRDLISTDPNLSIRDCVKKHLLLLAVVMLISDPDPDLAKFLNKEPDTGYVYNIVPKTILKRLQVSSLRMKQPQLEVVQLKKKVKNLEVMLQKLQLKNGPEPKKEDIESFLKRMAAEYTQLKTIQKKRLGF